MTRYGIIARRVATTIGALVLLVPWLIRQAWAATEPMFTFEQAEFDDDVVSPEVWDRIVEEIGPLNGFE